MRWFNEEYFVLKLFIEIFIFNVFMVVNWVVMVFLFFVNIFLVIFRCKREGDSDEVLSVCCNIEINVLLISWLIEMLIEIVIEFLKFYWEVFI